MIDVPHSPDGPSFGESLSALIEAAHRNGSDVEGAWKCSIDGDSDVYWDVQITRVVYETDED